jgi:molecular chaperone DnaK
MTRSKLEELTNTLIDKSLEPCKRALEDAGLSASDIGEVVMVGGMTRMPLVQKKVEEFFSKKPHLGVNPDEVVATGAAIQAGILQGDVKDVLLLDVTPLTLGLETLGGVRTPLIDRNTTIPTSKSQVFSTAADNQTSVEIHVLQGEREFARDNKTLGKFILDGIPPSPRGVPQVDVTFDIDANGILNVSAKDKASGKEQKITITASSSLSKEEVEKMRQDADSHAEEDKKKKDLIEVQNMADSLIYTTKKTLTDMGDKVDANVKKVIEEKVKAVEDVKDKEDVAAIKKATDELSSEVQKIGQAAYQAQQQQAQNEGSDSEKDNSGKDTEGETADFEEVDEKDSDNSDNGDPKKE